MSADQGECDPKSNRLTWKDILCCLCCCQTATAPAPEPALEMRSLRPSRSGRHANPTVTAPMVEANSPENTTRRANREGKRPVHDAEAPTKSPTAALQHPHQRLSNPAPPLPTFDPTSEAGSPEVNTLWHPTHKEGHTHCWCIQCAAEREAKRQAAVEMHSIENTTYESPLQNETQEQPSPPRSFRSVNSMTFFSGAANSSNFGKRTPPSRPARAQNSEPYIA